MDAPDSPGTSPLNRESWNDSLESEKGLDSRKLPHSDQQLRHILGDYTVDLGNAVVQYKPTVLSRSITT